MSPKTLILQTNGSFEVRQMSALAMLRDIRKLHASVQVLSRLHDELEQGALPIGSVPFVRQAMRLAGINEPKPLSYPLCLRSFLCRELKPARLGDLRHPENPEQDYFIKPSATKLFGGFVRSSQAPSDFEKSYILEQEKTLQKLPATTTVFISPVVRFVSEYRYYIHRHAIVGMARYDDGHDENPAPALDIVERMIEVYAKSGQAPVAYSLDVGVLDNGQTALVEVNDAWALGLYSEMDNRKAYLQMLDDRWQELRGKVFKLPAPKATKQTSSKKPPQKARAIKSTTKPLAPTGATPAPSASVKPAKKTAKALKADCAQSAKKKTTKKTAAATPSTHPKTVKTKKKDAH